MTKAEIVDALAAKAGLSKAAGEKVLNAFLVSVQEILRVEGRLNLSGLGAFVVEERKARKGRNPRTGESIIIAAAKVVKFRAGKKLKDSIA
jgi:DNA-binding protein HU-beta